MIQIVSISQKPPSKSPCAIAMGAFDGIHVGHRELIRRTVEQAEAAAAVKAVDGRAKREKVAGYTILLFSDNSPLARENAFKAKEAFEHNFRDTKLTMYYESPSFYVTAGAYLTMEEAVIELNRFRQIFPKAIVQSKELEVEQFTKIEGLHDKPRRSEESRIEADTTATEPEVDSLVGKIFEPVQ